MGSEENEFPRARGERGGGTCAARRAGRAVVPLLLLVGAGNAPALDPSRSIEQYTRQSWSVLQGFPQSTVSSVVQDHDGYVWAATYGGLVRFDGVRAVVFTSARDPGLPSDRLTALAVDAQQRLWIGTEDAGLCVREEGRFRRVPLAPGAVRVRRLLAGRGNGVWVGTDVGLFRVGPEDVKRHGKVEGLPSEVVTALDLGPDGEVWVGTEAGLCVLGPAGFVPRFTSVLGGRTVHAIELGRSAAWIGAGARIFRLEGEKLREVAGPRRGTVLQLLEDRSGNLWAGTYEGGLERLAPRVGTLDLAPGLANNTVLSLIEDREGNLWIGMSGGGLARLSDGDAVGIGIPTPERSVSTVPVVGDGADGVFVGGGGVGIAHVGPRGVEVLRPAGTPIPTSVWALARDPDGTLWIGTWGDGLWRLSPGERLERFGGPATRSRTVRAIVRTEAGALVGGDGGAWRFDLARRAFERIEGTAEMDVHSLDLAPDGTVWIGSSEGIHFVPKAGPGAGPPSPRPLHPALAGILVRAILRDPSGVVWAGTYGGGLQRIEGQKVTVFGSRNGLFEDVVSRLVEDSSERFWMTGNRGVTRVSREKLEAWARAGAGALDAELFDASSGMRSSECNGGGQPAGHLGDDGRLWVPTLDGIAVFDTRRGARGAAGPPVKVEEVIVAGAPADRDASPVSIASGEQLEIRYTALSFRRPGKIRFRTRLEGLDVGWVDAGARRVAYYPYLPPGTYRFLVQAAGDDGSFGPPTPAIELRRVPRFVETFWFGALLVLVGSVAAGALARGAVAAARRRAARLAQVVAERTAELERLVSIAEKVSRGTLLPEVLEHVYDSLHDVIPYDRIGLALLDAERLVLRAVWSRSAARRLEIGEGYEAPITSSSLGNVLERGEPRILNDLVAYLEAHPSSESTRRIVQEGIRSSLTLPLRVEGRPVGAVFFSSFRAGAYHEGHVRLLSGIAGHVSIAITKSRLYEDLLAAKAGLETANAELARLASVDPLTGLANRRVFDDALAREWNRALRAASPMAVLMIDVDHFKSYNDAYGHAAGDDCLREVADVVASAVRRTTDLAARWGGEEFVVVLPDSGPEEAAAVAGKIREALAQRAIPHAASPTGAVTVSIGGAATVATPGQDPSDLPRRADEALYAAKRGGRDRAVVPGAGPGPDGARREAQGGDGPRPS